MNNEIQRKITSLTLMTIMLAGGMVIASPGFMPEAHAVNANLFVSAENSQFDNYMSGPQVIEVVVIDSDISDTDEAKGEPDVTINGKIMRMVQAVDGNWYGYFADKKQALIADSTAGSNTGLGLDFGGYCDSTLVLNGDTGPTAASGTLTLTSADPGDTITINSILYTAVTGTAGSQEFSIDGTDIADAAALVTSINTADVLLNAVNSGSSTITITVIATGATGNGLGIASTTGSTFTSITDFTGGVNAIQATSVFTHDGNEMADEIAITIGGETYIGLSGGVGDFNFDTDGNGAADFAALVSEVTARTSIVTVASTTTTLTITAIAIGTAGNTITVTAPTATVTIPDANMGGTSSPAVAGENAVSAVGLVTLDDVQHTTTAIVNGITYSAIVSSPSTIQFIATGSDNSNAANLASAIDSNESLVNAVAVSTNVITITAGALDSTGNSIGLIGDIDIIASATTLLGGTAITAKAQQLDFTETVGVYIPATAGISVDANGNADGATTTASCGTVLNGAGTTPGNNVVREAKDINVGSTTVASGQIGVDSEQWPFIQLYDLSVGTNVNIQYNKGGGAQSATLTFDEADDFANLSLDQSTFTRDAQVHAIISDTWLNIDPTDEDSWTFGTLDGSLSTNYQVFDENGGTDGAGTAGGIIDISSSLSDLMGGDVVLIINPDAQNRGTNVLTLQDNGDSVLNSCSQDMATCSATNADGSSLDAGTNPVTITESQPNSGVFTTFDESDVSVIIMTSDALRGTSATIDYNDSPVSILVGFEFATIDIQPIDDEWNSGEEIPVILIDADANKNSRVDEDLILSDPTVALIPSLTTGDPFTLGEAGVEGDTVAKAAYVKAAINFVDNTVTATVASGDTDLATITVNKYSERAIITPTGNTGTNALVIDYGTTAKELKASLMQNSASNIYGFNFLNIDVSSLDTSGNYNVYLVNATGKIIADDGLLNAITSLQIGSSVSAQSFTQLTDTIVDVIFRYDDSVNIGIVIEAVTQTDVTTSSDDAVVVDFFSYGFINDGLEGSERVANQIIRIEAEETGDNTGTFEGSLEYIMVNQINILDASTYSGLSTIDSGPGFIVIEDLTDEDAPRVNYLDLGSDGVATQIADQEEAPSHSGVVSFDSSNYKTADTVVITLEDLDLNTDSDLLDIYTIVNDLADQNQDTIGSGNSTSGGTSITLSTGDELGRLLDVTFDDQRWTEGNSCNLDSAIDAGLGATGFTLVETGTATGVFTGDFQIPSQWCRTDASAPESATGLDIEVNYVDFRDASGETIEVGDSAGIRAHTGSVSLDRTVYPVPFGVESDFVEQSSKESPTGRALFPIHASGMGGTDGLDSGEFITGGDLIIHIRVNDPDFDISASGEDTIASNSTDNRGPVKVSVIRGSSSVILGYAGGPSSLDGTIDTDGVNTYETRAFGPMVEIAPDAGIFESDITIRYTDGPASTKCSSETLEWTALNGDSTTEQTDRFDMTAASGNYCILQGDILQVQYTDPADASGDVNTITDSATFDLRNGVLQSDKSVYIIGSDMILTLIEPDFDLDNDQAETYDLDLIEWDSDAATISMGDKGGEAGTFDPEPLNFRETGDSTGIFQIVIEIPESLGGDNLERGEEIVLEYTDWGPSGSDYVGEEEEDVNVTVFTSNFGATVELDQKVYTWTDKVYITIVAPDHNFDSDLVDEIGNTSSDPIKVSTRGHNIDEYKLVETGTDTGIFTGEVILTGFAHNADGDTTTGDINGDDVTFMAASGSGPTDGLLPADDDDGLTVSFEFSEDETVVGSALIRWNIGEVQWLEASYPASGTGVIRVIDPDMNLDPEAVDNFNVDVWSDSDAGGIDLTVTETNEATGIYEGTVFFTTTDESSGHRLRVAEGDTVTAEYEDNTLPDPYTTADELDITATSLIGTVVPPLERAPAANLRTVDAFGNSLDTVSVDQQVQISADLANGQDRDQTFAYLVQIQDGDGVTVSLAWITGTLSSGQSFSPALSWIPTSSGSYTATAFVWESVDNPTALSPPVSTTISVS